MVTFPTRKSTAWLAIALVVLALCGCPSSTSSTSDAPGTEAFGEVALPDSSGELRIVAPDGSGPDAHALDLTAMDAEVHLPTCEDAPGMQGCPCVENSDCDGGWCVFHLGDTVCTIDCIEECPDGWTCQQTSGFGADEVFICVSPYPALCLPCVQSADCPSPDSHCIPYGGGGGGFCGGACGKCPEGYECADILTSEGVSLKQCIAISGECSCSAHAAASALGTNCEISNDAGACQGWRFCSADGLGDCDAPLPVPEICFNDLDDDCDGTTDPPDLCCVPACEGKECGDDGCGGSCGNCPVNHVCEITGICLCQPNCEGKECGPDGCGGECGECDAGTMCSFGECQPGCDEATPCEALKECVDGFCQPNVPDAAHLLPPVFVETVPGETSLAVFCKVMEADLTPGSGAAEGLTAELGWGPPGFDPSNDPPEWQWAPAEFSSDSGDWDMWNGTLSNPAPAEFRFTFRFTLDGEHWLYADASGTNDGFDPGKLGEWVVLASPELLEFIPDHGTILGGDSVMVKGSGFKDGMTILVGGAEVEVQLLSEDSAVFVTSAHDPGAVDIVVTNPSGQSATAHEGFQFVLRFSPVLDGDLEEWPDAALVGKNTLESDWGPDKNQLEKLYAAYDSGYLYVAFSGFTEEHNYVVGYIDGDFGTESGSTNMVDLSDNDGDGDLDDALSNVLEVIVPGFGGDVGFGTRGLASFQMGNDLAGSLYVGWRDLGPPYNLAWLQGSVLCSEGACEAALPLPTLYTTGVPAKTEVAVFLKLTDKYGDVVGLSNQTLPEFYNDEEVSEIGAAASFTLFDGQ